MALAESATLPGRIETGAAGEVPRRTTRAFRFAIACVLAAAVAFAFQLHRLPAVYTGSEIVPSDNDAFYHARRILDTAQDPSAFYQFDPHIQAPAGSLIVWPWGYDFLVATIVRAATGLGLAQDPMTALAYVPPFAVIVTIMLATLLAWNVGLSTWATALLLFSIALSPLTQVMHGVACVDHHFAEYIFILAFLASSTGWLRNPGSTRWAVAVGTVLGLAPSMHTLLFVLQLPLLLCAAVLWIRNRQITAAAVGPFSAALLLSTALVTAFSLPLQQGYFQHYYLSWFHVYVACSTVVAIGYMATRNYSGRGLLLLLSACALLAVPLLAQVLQAAGYLSNSSAVLTNIGEAHSVLRRFREGPWDTIRLYSALILLAPAILIACVAMIPRVRAAPVIMVCVYSALSIPLLLSQFRFHYYGSIGLVLPVLLLADRLARHRPRGALLAAGMAVMFVIAYVPSIHMAVVSERTVGRDPYFILTRRAMPALAEACREDPGIVLAKNNEGHFIRYYTDCSVIANNFLLTAQQIEAFRKVAELFWKSPAELSRESIPIKYVLVRARASIATRPDGAGYMMVDKEDAKVVSDPLSDALLWSDPETVPANFKLLTEIEAPGRDYPYARLWKISRPGT